MFKGILAHTLVEITVAIAIFSMIMLGVYSAIDTGFKIWRLGEVKSDVYSRGKVLLSYIIRDFRYSNWISAKIENDGDSNTLNEYIVFESPVKDDGSIDIETKNCKPLWQKYIYYYIYPSVKNRPEVDKRILYRRMVDRTPKNSTPMPLSEISSTYLTDESVPDTNLRVIGREIYEIDFKQVGTGLIITIKFKSRVHKDSPVMFNNRNVTEVVKLKASVIPEN
ncbi:MAG TPA: prepilin-type N-terminal cleavage/methylation domain-containing protein [Candidatus Eremiobacteraeota bacterium]|nr:MAG: hypothetical protein BWY64_03074 [bacterium ADurb.Bin363]HPZ08950.1 prepilin-type N-terminal cleavage/methylation domain-containing protein [Candidatus Eremiobacteraeota bacterium]